MRLTMAILADAASVERGKFYIHGGGWDTIWTQNFPVAHPALSLVMAFKLSYEEAHDPQPYRIDLVDEDDGALPFGFASELAVGIAPGTRRDTEISVPTQLTWNGLLFNAPGRYRFRIWTKEELLGEAPLTVLHMTPPLAVP